jgi:hypothetical protein
MVSRAAKQIFVGSRLFERNLEGSTIELRVAEKRSFLGPLPKTTRL